MFTALAILSAIMVAWLFLAVKLGLGAVAYFAVSILYVLVGSCFNVWLKSRFPNALPDDDVNQIIVVTWPLWALYTLGVLTYSRFTTTSDTP